MPESGITPPRRRQRRTVQYALLGVGGVMLVAALVGDRGVAGTRQAQRDIIELESSLADVQTENDGLREQARQLRDDPAALEEIARRELGLIRPGEKLFILKDVPAASVP